MNRTERNRLSAEWAAYGDALGFITELADTERVQYRIGAGQLLDTISWKRKIGGFSGVSVDFPAGSYSDDTQLRLSTSRAIRGDGSFDVAAFAKVELPTWTNYALGAGIGTKEAASNLARTSATWYSNFFKGKKSSYVQSGGNGAAMRVQPHVWAASDLTNLNVMLLNVVRNAVCTHGHARGILGACFHALTLAFSLREGRPANINEIKLIIDDLKYVPALVKDDGDLRLFWLGTWTEASEMSFESAVRRVLDEMLEDIKKLELLRSSSPQDLYADAITAIGATESTSRGSGTKTAILAAFASSMADMSDLKATLLMIINALGSDTDSIATMAGAILGSCCECECEGSIQDREYIRSEAYRLAIVAEGGRAASFRYPDIRSWKPERAAIDAVGLLDRQLWLSGLGPLEPLEPLEPLDKRTHRDRNGHSIGWYKLPFGQTILAQVRSSPRAITVEHSAVNEHGGTKGARSSSAPPGKLRDLFAQSGGRQITEKTEIEDKLAKMSLNELLQQVLNAGFPAELIGRVLLQQVDAGGKDFVERGVALTATILTAYEARTRRRRN